MSEAKLKEIIEDLQHICRQHDIYFAGEIGILNESDGEVIQAYKLVSRYRTEE